MSLGFIWNQTYRGFLLLFLQNIYAIYRSLYAGVYAGLFMPREIPL